MLVVHIALGGMQQYVLDFMRRGQTAPLPTGDDGVRPLVLSRFLRRSALKALMTFEKKRVSRAAGDSSLVWADWTGPASSLRVRVLTDSDPNRALISIDIEVAFQNPIGESITTQIQAHDPMYTSLVRWYDTTVRRRVLLTSGDSAEAISSQGVDQGCSQSAYCFAMGTKIAIQDTPNEAR